MIKKATRDSIGIWRTLLLLSAGLSLPIPALATSVTVSWTDNSSNESGFRIERSSNSQPFEPLVSVGSNVTSYADTSVAPDTAYTYRVFAFNDAGTSSPSNEATATIPGDPALPPNSPPSISSLADVILPEDGVSAPIDFTIGDAETAADSLTVSVTTSDSSLLPASGMSLAGSGTDRTLTLAPAANQFGSATVTVEVSDGDLSASSSFNLQVNPVNDLPSISALPDLTADAGGQAGPVAFTVGDVETSANSLGLAGTSSNPSVVPLSGIVFGGSGTNRTVMIYPSADTGGTAIVTVTVDDGTDSASQSFSVTVAPPPPPNTAPTVSPFADLVLPEDGVSAPIGFTIGDAETAAGSLTVSVTTSDSSLLPTSGISLAGSGTDRTLTLAPAANQFGAATVTIEVSDGDLSASSSFMIDVTPVNDAPVIGTLADLSLSSGQSAGPYPLSVWDAETAADALVLVASSSNSDLLPVSSIALGGSGPNRTVAVTPTPGASGSATVSLTLSDGNLSAKSQFTVTVAPTGPMSATFTDFESINIPNEGAATPYGAPIQVSGMSGTIQSIRVQLLGLFHAQSDDLDVLLVGPDGTTVLLMSDVGSRRVRFVDLTFTDGNAPALPQSGAFDTGVYIPTNYGAGIDPFPAPAPAGPYGDSLANLHGTDANGTWMLYVVDDGKKDSGRIGGGWTLELTTSGLAAPDPTNPAAPLSSDTAFLYGFSNLSDRAAGETLSFSFALQGEQPGTVLLRALGPALASIGVEQPSPAPRLTLGSLGGDTLLDLSGWDGSAAVADAADSVGGLPLAFGSNDAAALASLDSQPYLIDVSDWTGAAGTVLTEIYLPDLTGSTRLSHAGFSRNLPVNGTLPSSFTIEGSGTRQLLILALGADGIGVPGAISDPVLFLYDSAGNLIAANDNWQAPTANDAAAPETIQDAMQLVGLGDLPDGSTDSALIVTLPPDAYLLEVLDAAGSLGIGSVEIYDLP